MTPPSPDRRPLSPDVSRALHDAFGDAPREELSVLATGRSGATVIELSVAGRRYIVRRPDPTRPKREGQSEREIACVTIASARGVAPPLVHVDTEACITITEKIDGAPFGRGPLPGPERVARIATALRTLHGGPPFPKGPSVAAVVHDFDRGLRAQGLEGVPDSVTGVIADVSRATARFAEAAPCHNDLNPGNILETADRVYFVDWETACAGDPFFDLAELGVFAFPSSEGRARVLAEYLGRAPTEEENAHATLSRSMALAFYTVAFMYVDVAAGGPGTLRSAPRPISELLVDMRHHRAGPDVIAASLHEEMRLESDADSYESAKRLLG